MPELGSGIHAFRPVEVDADAAEEYWAKFAETPNPGS